LRNTERYWIIRFKKLIRWTIMYKIYSLLSLLILIPNTVFARYGWLLREWSEHNAFGIILLCFFGLVTISLLIGITVGVLNIKTSTWKSLPEAIWIYLLPIIILIIIVYPIAYYFSDWDVWISTFFTWIAMVYGIMGQDKK